jgi:hypothetical protein
MRTFCKAMLALGVAALLAGPASAKYHGRAGAFLLLNKSVQQELKLDQSQIDKITAALQKVGDEYKGDVAKLRGPNISRQERAELGSKIAKASRKAVKGILRPEQAKRFHQIRVQAAGVYAFLSPRVQKTIKMTDPQKAEFKAIATSYGQARHASFHSAQGDRGKAFAQAVALRKEKMAAAMKVLTGEQQKAYKEMVGVPFHKPLAAAPIPPKGGEFKSPAAREAFGRAFLAFVRTGQAEKAKFAAIRLMHTKTAAAKIAAAKVYKANAAVARAEAMAEVAKAKVALAKAEAARAVALAKVDVAKYNLAKLEANQAEQEKAVAVKRVQARSAFAKAAAAEYLKAKVAMDKIVKEMAAAKPIAEPKIDASKKVAQPAPSKPVAAKPIGKPKGAAPPKAAPVTPTKTVAAKPTAPTTTKPKETVRH